MAEIRGINHNRYSKAHIQIFYWCLLEESNVNIRVNFTNYPWDLGKYQKGPEVFKTNPFSPLCPNGPNAINLSSHPFLYLSLFSFLTDKNRNFPVIFSVNKQGKKMLEWIQQPKRKTHNKNHKSIKNCDKNKNQPLNSKS